MAPAIAGSEVEAAYREEGARLWRALFAFSGDEEIASDAVAEAFAQAVARGSAIRDVRRWVWRTAYRLAAGELKGRSRIAPGPVPELFAVDLHEEDGLLDALQALTPQQRIVIVLHYYLDWPVRDISRRTGINPLAVRAHLSRGRKRLRHTLDGHR